MKHILTATLLTLSLIPSLASALDCRGKDYQLEACIEQNIRENEAFNEENSFCEVSRRIGDVVIGKTITIKRFENRLAPDTEKQLRKRMQLKALVKEGKMAAGSCDGEHY